MLLYKKLIFIQMETTNLLWTILATLWIGIGHQTALTYDTSTEGTFGFAARLLTVLAGPINGLWYIFRGSNLED